MLSRAGWQVDIFESAARLDGRGAGIVTHKALLDVLRKLDIAAGDNLGLMIETRKVFDREGLEIATAHMPQLVTSWGRLHRLLKAEFPSHRYHGSHTLVDIDQDESGVTAFFDNGQQARSSLLIGADGIRSTVRQLFEPSSNPEYAGYVAWRGLIDESELSPSELETVFPYFTFCLPPGEQVLAYPVMADDDSGFKAQRRCNAVWYRPADPERQLPDLLTDIDGVNNGSSIAPDRVRPSVIASMREDSLQLLAPQHGALIRRIAQPFIQPIYDVNCASMVYGRVAMLGDAAFTARPHLGMGVTKAAEDAEALLRCLSEGDPVVDSLINFKSTRQSVNASIVERSRQLGAYLQANLDSGPERDLAANHTTAEAVLAETATDNFSV